MGTYYLSYYIWVRNTYMIENFNKGHRIRLREKFLKSPCSLHDYEILELALFMAHPRIDVKTLAKKILLRFKSFAAAISAEPSIIKQIDGAGDSTVATLKIIHQAVIRCLKPAEKICQLDSINEVATYCRTMMGYDSIEQFRVIFLNSKNNILADEIQQTGTINRTNLYIRELIKNAMNYGAASIILIHNHPSGDPTPSQADIDLTKLVYDACLKVQIQLHDHIIVSKTSHFSFLERGLLRAIQNL